MNDHSASQNSGDRLSSEGISQTKDDPSRQAQPLSVPPGIPYPSIVGSGAMPNVAGATIGRQEGDEGIINGEGTLPELKKPGMPNEHAIPSRKVQDDALLSDNGAPLQDSTLHFEKQSPPTHGRDSSHSGQLSLSEKPRRASNSNASTSDSESTNEKSTRRGKKSKKVKKAKETGPKPVSIFQLYRFHTPMEKLLNIGALVLAAAAGATQPLMTYVLFCFQECPANSPAVSSLVN